MALRSAGRKLSFEILRNNSSPEEDEETLIQRSISDPIRNQFSVSASDDYTSQVKPNRKKRRKKKKTIINSTIPEDPIVEKKRFDCDSVFDNSTSTNSVSEIVYVYSVGTVVCEESGGNVRTETKVAEPGFQNLRVGEVFNHGELRQRTVNGSGSNDGVVEDVGSRVCNDGKVENSAESSSAGKQRNELNGSLAPKLEPAESLDWKRLMAEDPNCEFMISFSYLANFISYFLCLLCF